MSRTIDRDGREVDHRRGVKGRGPSHVAGAFDVDGFVERCLRRVGSRVVQQAGEMKYRLNALDGGGNVVRFRDVADANINRRVKETGKGRRPAESSDAPAVRPEGLDQDRAQGARRPRDQSLPRAALARLGARNFGFEVVFQSRDCTAALSRAL